MATIKNQVIIDLEVDSKDVKQSNQDINNLTQKIILLEKQIKSNKTELKKSDAELQRNGTTRKALSVTIAKEQQSLGKARRERTQSIKVVKAESTSLNGLMASTNKMVASRNKQILSTKKGRAEFARLTTQINKNNVALKKYDAQISRNQRNVGNYPKGLGAMQSGFSAVTVGIGAAVGVLMAFGKAMSYTIEFEAQMSKVKAITGATDTQLQLLKQTALDLGSSTAFTATQVGELQTELGKLGFTTSEIINSQGGILDLAAATGETLAESALVAGGALRAFGLDASEMGRVTDVMALSFSSSGLDLEKFKESMKLVAPIAKSAGISLETTTALLGNLSDNMLSGSIAGTGLKNLLSKLSNENSSLSKELGYSVKNSDDLVRAFKDLKTKNIDLTKATELTDERSKAAFLTMIDGIDSTEKLAEALENAEGSAKKMADTMLKNLAGDIKFAESAWEAFMISLTSGGGAISQTSREITQDFTDFLGVLTAWNNGQIGFWDAMSENMGDLETENLKAWRSMKDVTIQNQKEMFGSLKESTEDTFDLYKNLNKDIGDLSVSTKEKELKTNEEIVEGEKELTAAQKAELDKRQKAHVNYLKNVSDGEMKLKELQINAMTEGYDKDLALINLAQQKEQANYAKTFQDKTQLDAALLLSDSNFLEQKAKLYSEAFDINKELDLENLEFKRASDILELETLRVQEELKFGIRTEYAEKEKERINIFENENVQKGIEIANAGVELFQTFQDRKLSILDSNEAQELANAGDNEDLKLQISKKYANERFKIEKKQFIANKAMQVANAGIDIASAIIANLKNPIMAILVGVLGAVQLATIVATPPPAAPTFARGGSIVGGGTHASGNDTQMYDQHGKFYGKVEKGEFMAVMSRKSTEALALSNFNVAHGGRSFFGESRVNNADGGSLAAQPQQQTQQDLSQIVSAIRNLQVAVNVNDINSAQDTQVKVLDNASY